MRTRGGGREHGREGGREGGRATQVMQGVNLKPGIPAADIGTVSDQELVRSSQSRDGAFTDLARGGKGKGEGGVDRGKRSDHRASSQGVPPPPSPPSGQSPISLPDLCSSRSILGP